MMPRATDTHVMVFRGIIVDSGKRKDIVLLLRELADWHAEHDGHYEPHPSGIPAAPAVYIEGKSPFTMRPITPPTLEDLPL